MPTDPTIKKYQITQLQNDDSLLVLHPETDADIVSVTNGSGAYGGQATNVQDALEEVYSLAQTGGVTGVKGDAETGGYRTGDVNITKANIGLGNVTNDAQVKGLASGTTSGHLVKFGADGYTIADAGADVTTIQPNSNSTDAQVPTSKAVYTAISNIPKPMVFKGTLGNNQVSGTINSLPSPSADKLGWVYKSIGGNNIDKGDGIQTIIKAGDLVVCVYKQGEYRWETIPSGDDVEDTWRAIFVNDSLLLNSGLTSGNLYFKNGSNITITGSGNDITIASSHPSITMDTDTTDSGTLAHGDTFTAITSVTKDTNGHVTKVNTKTYTLPADSDTHNSHKVISGVKPSGSGTANIESATASSGDITLGDSGIAVAASGQTDAGFATYSALKVNAKGIAVAGGTIIEVGATNQTTPSNNLAVGGIFFKEV